tara:strand:- start:442 stop:678 length:237 start_codon:yes stop_codon:yes gene_type:complete
MFKTLMNKDEMVEQHSLNGNQFNKVDKIMKKEVLEKEKPINPKYVFDGKITKKIVTKNYRKPKPKNDSKKPLISLNDW